MRLLCVSDIHGYSDALDAVLREASDRGWDQLIVCGDLCFPGPEPLKVWKTLIAHNALCVQGLTDRALAEVTAERLKGAGAAEQARVKRFLQMQVELGELILARLARLPTIASLPLESGHTMTIVHGSPTDPTEPVTVDMSDEEISAVLGTSSGDLVVCGGSHVSFERQVGDVRVVSVGSVGEAPDSRYAHATFILTTPEGVTVEPFFALVGAESA